MTYSELPFTRASTRGSPCMYVLSWLATKHGKLLYSLTSVWPQCPCLLHTVINHSILGTLSNYALLHLLPKFRKYNCIISRRQPVHDFQEQLKVVFNPTSYGISYSVAAMDGVILDSISL